MLTNTTIIILTKNEIESIEFTLDELEKNNFKNILVVDANSKDGTTDLITKRNIKFISQKNSGYGAAILEGIENVTTKYVSIIDADGSYNGNDIPKMLDLLEDENLDFVLGSRYLNKNKSEDDTFIRALGNKIFTWILRFFFRVSITDALFHFPVCKTEAYKNLNLNYKDFSICPELPIKINEMGYKFREFLSLERPRIGGSSKVNALTDGLKITYSLLKLFFLLKIFKKK